MLSPTPWRRACCGATRGSGGAGRSRAQAVRDGIAVAYPRFPQPPRRLLFERLGDVAYVALRRRLASLRAAGFDLIHAHQALPDGALAARLSADLGVPYVVTVHGADVYQHLRQPGPVRDRTVSVLRQRGARHGRLVHGGAPAGARGRLRPSARGAQRHDRHGLGRRRRAATTCRGSRCCSPSAT